MIGSMANLTYYAKRSQLCKASAQVPKQIWLKPIAMRCSRITSHENILAI